jgi:hypothetical protein
VFCLITNSFDLFTFVIIYFALFSSFVIFVSFSLNLFSWGRGGGKSRDCSVGIEATGWTAEEQGFYSRQTIEASLNFSTASRPALGPIRRVPAPLSPGVERRGRKADHSLHVVPR